jgi:hypothetical protein
MREEGLRALGVVVAAVAYSACRGAGRWGWGLRARVWHVCAALLLLVLLVLALILVLAALVVPRWCWWCRAAAGRDLQFVMACQICATTSTQARTPCTHPATTTFRCSLLASHAVMHAAKGACHPQAHIPQPQQQQPARAQPCPSSSQPTHHRAS